MTPRLLLIQKAASLPVGSVERKDILAALTKEGKADWYYFSHQLLDVLNGIGDFQDVWRKPASGSFKKFNWGHLTSKAQQVLALLPEHNGLLMRKLGTNRGLMVKELLNTIVREAPKYIAAQKAYEEAMAEQYSAFPASSKVRDIWGQVKNSRE